MLYRKFIVSTRTISQLTAALIFLVSGVGSALAATNSGNPPLLVPYLIQSLAGNTQPTSSGGGPAAGYGGDGQVAISPTQISTLSGDQMVIVDSVGNVYIADTGNAIIREINANTGIINTVAGQDPSNCTAGSTTCAKLNNGCADGVPAKGDPIGKTIEGLAVDGYGNLYFSDITTETISIVYRGGTQVANFIKLVNPAGVAKSNGVQAGYVYHVAGSVNLQTCVPATVRNNDNLPAFADTSQPSYIAAVTTSTPATLSNAASLNLNSPSSQLSVDSAGNIYVIDVSNNVIRVVNTQATPQIFFDTLVQPGYVTAIIDCSIYTVACPATITTTVGTGINGPANAVSYVGDLGGTSADAYGNVYEVNYKGANPGIYAGAAYAGGPALAKLQNVEWGITVSYGNFYQVINNVAINTTLPNAYEGVLAACCGAASGGGGIAIRPVSLTADSFGTLWYWDEHYPSIFRIDQYNSVATTIAGWGGTAEVTTLTSPSGCDMRCESGIAGKYATWAAPQYCVYGTPSNPYTLGPQTFDRFADGCPALISDVSEVEAGIVVADGPGNLYFADQGNNLIRELPLDNYFPSTPVGTTVTQPIQVHFDSSNNPNTGATSLPNLFTTSFSIPGSDFSINTTTPEFQMGSIGFFGFEYTLGPTNNCSPTQGGVPPYTGGCTLALYAGIPSCTELGQAGANNTSMDCLVYVNFKPSAAGPRTAPLVTTTANGSVYDFPLIGYGTGGQLAIDGGKQTPITTTGLGKATAVAVTSTGTIYIADPANNRIVIEPAGGGAQTVIGPSFSLVVPAPSGSFTSSTTSATLSGPKGVAVDSANNLYISDTGNNRILEYNPNTQTAAQIGLTLWQACTTPAASSIVAGSAGYSTPGSPAKTSLACTASGTTVPQYAFNGPQGLAVDLYGNVYVADTGNGVVVEIPSNIDLGGAIPLLQYPGAPALTAPVAVAIGPYFNYATNTITENSIFVADPGNPSGYVVELPPGGGDLQTVPGALYLGLGLGGFGSGLSSPDGVAVDGIGNVYISDSSLNEVVEVPANAPNGAQFPISFTGLSAPGGLALDLSGNLYVADTGNSRVLADLRQNPIVSFGTVPQDLGSPSGVAGTPLIGGQPCPVNGIATPCTGILTLTNTGTTPITLSQPLATVTSVSPAGDTAFAITTTCGATLLAGATCTVSPTFNPTTNGPQMENVDINGTNSLALMANETAVGEFPLANIVLSSSLGTSPPAGSAPVITATVTQTHPSVIFPTGSVTFNYTVDSTGSYAVYAGQCGASSGSVTSPINPANGTATYQLPALGAGRQYVITATYNGNATDSSPTQATPLPLVTPPITPISAVSPSYTMIYGAAPPNLNATGGGESLTGILASDASTVTYKFVSAASSTSFVTAPTNPAVPAYPISVVFSGGNFCNYGAPTVTTTAGGTTQSTVTEGPTPLTVAFSAPFASVYGAPDVYFGTQITFTGAVNGDQKKFLESFLAANTSTPPAAGTVSSSHSSLLPVGIYSVTPSLSAGNPVLPLNYTITRTPGILTVTQAPSSIAIVAFNNSTTASSTSYFSVTPGAKVTGSLFTNYLTTAVPGGTGTPTGTVTIYDSFTPITFPATGTTGTSLGLGAIVPPCTLPFLGVTTNNSVSVTGIASTFDLQPGESVTGAGIPNGATIATVLGGGIITLSAPATASSPAALITSAVAGSTACNPAVGTINLVGGNATFTPNITVTPLNQIGTDQFIFAYSGDTNFLPFVTSVNTAASAQCLPNNIVVIGSVATSNCILVDNADFFVSTPTNYQGLTEITPGYVPNPNNTSSAQTWPVNVNSLLSETGIVTLTCLPIGNPNATLTAATTSGSPTLTGVTISTGLTVGGTITGPGILSGTTVLSIGTGTITLSANATVTATNVVFTYAVPPPTGATTVLTAQSYIQCLVTPPTLTLTSGGTLTAVLSVSTPASEPLGFNFYSMVPTKGSATVLAFLPLGIFAFCMRRRRRLSKALWMLVIIALVSVGMSGCGGNTVSFYSPIPLGPQYVTVYVSGTSITAPNPTLLRSFTVEINIQ